MKTIIATAFATLLATTAFASGLDVRGQFASVSATGIAMELPRNADDFSALFGQVGGVTVSITNDLIDVDTISGSLTEIDGWRNNNGGIGAALGFSGVRGSFERN